MNDASKNKFDIVIIVILVVLSLGLIWFNYSLPDSYRTTENFFVLQGSQFLASILLGYFLQRIQSREEFQNDLKKYALSAYRRIIDIGKIIDRLFLIADNAKVKADKGKVSEIDIIQEIIISAKFIISSSNADWVDIIGEELKKKERIDELQELAAQIKSSPPKPAAQQKETNDQLEQIRKELYNLRSDLPFILQDNKRMDNYGGPFEPKFSPIISRYIFDQVEKTGYVTLSIDIDPNKVEEFIRKINSLVFISDAGMGQYHIGAIIEPDISGELVNPFENIVSTNDFAITLTDLLSDISKSQNQPVNDGRGLPYIKINGIEYVGVTEYLPYRIIFRFPAKTDMIAKG